MAVELGGRLGDARHGAVCGTPLEPVKSGRGDWIRTSDPLRPRQVRYQAALRPDILLVIVRKLFSLKEFSTVRRWGRVPRSSSPILAKAT